MNAVSISAYEQQRLDNIARNEAFLDAHGLGPSVPKLCEKKRITKKPRVEQQSWGSRPLSLRNQGQPAPDYVGLSQSFFDAEERAADAALRMAARRESMGGSRQRKPTQRWQHPDDVIVHRVRRPAPTQSAPRRVVAPDQAIYARTVGAVPSEVVTGGRIAYPTNGRQGKCHRCHHWFVVNKDGTLHKHDCRVVPVLAVLPVI